ncbi:unnamed protein product [Cylindrotheca closterium]|uniref:VOC domain-containing protein n=1 Tax=Cylindrotheca closterium TaxID=2856 RepID=A0AAD2PVN8_9STRA|nr:unnamed protein product [Cylindrotheca closterium]
MKVKIISVPVSDQAKAFAFYTEKLLFVKKQDVEFDDGNRWLTVVSPDALDGPEVLLEPAPLSFEPTKTYQKAVFEAGIPWTQFDVEDCQKEYDRLVELGVEFFTEPEEMGPVKIATFNDTCGNRIQIVEGLSDER